MTDFPNMAGVVPVGAKGVASVFHQSFDENTAARASYAGGKYIATPPGTYAFLYVDQESDGGKICMMSDLSYERTTCSDAVARAHGHVLIAGLGLGMILHPIIASSRVKSVTVVEKYRDVVELIRPTLPASDKLTIVHADIFEWRPPEQARYDCIWLDIWPDILPARLAEMAVLRERFTPYLNHSNLNCWLESWHEQETQALVNAQELSEHEQNN